MTSFNVDGKTVAPITEAEHAAFDQFHYKYGATDVAEFDNIDVQTNFARLRRVAGYVMDDSFSSGFPDFSATRVRAPLSPYPIDSAEIDEMIKQFDRIVAPERAVKARFDGRPILPVTRLEMARAAELVQQMTTFRFVPVRDRDFSLSVVNDCFVITVLSKRLANVEINFYSTIINRGANLGFVA